MNKKNYSFDLENFKDMLQICPNLHGQKFEDPPFEEEILAFIRELGYPEDIKLLFDVKVDTLYQLWRTFRTIINKCLSDQLNPRRNKVDYHMAKDDPILTTMRFIPKHETVQKYDAILPDTLTNQAMKESDVYKTYYDLATRKAIPKPKYVWRSTREKTGQAPKAYPGKRFKATAKVAKSRKKKQPAKGLETLSEVVLSEAEQMQIIYWKFSDDEDDNDQDDDNVDDEDDDNADNQDDDDQDDDNEQTKSDNNGDDLVHPKLSTFDEEERHEEKIDNEEEGSDLRVQTPSHFESTDNETYNDVTQGDNVEEENLDEEMTNKEEELNELYNDVNINLEGRDTEMIDTLLANVQATQVIEDTHVIMTVVTPEVQQQSSSVSSGFISNMLNPTPDAGIDSIHNLNTESTSFVDIPVTTNDEIPPSSITTLPPPPIPFIHPLQQTPVFSPTIAQTNLFELELKKILIDKMESNKSINRLVQQKTLYKALMDAYETDKVILETYGDIVTFKRRRDDKDENKEPFAGSNRGSKRRRAGKEHESTSAPKEKTSKLTGSSKEGLVKDKQEKDKIGTKPDKNGKLGKARQ
nr:hypothetical protein [Tanacetum cinerariifolium]